MLTASAAFALFAIGLSGLALVNMVRTPTDDQARAAEEDAQWAAELHTINDAMSRLRKHRAKIARREARSKP